MRFRQLRAPRGADGSHGNRWPSARLRLANRTARVGRSRVTLRSVVHAFDEGASPEGIVLRYPSLSLTDTYAAITYYLRHGKEVEQMLADEDREIEELHQQIERLSPTADLRTRLRRRLAERRATGS